jgi:uncharacterized protein (TIGR02246 family)
MGGWTVNIDRKDKPLKNDQDRAADELAVRNLIARIAHCADESAVEGYADLYAEDAVWGMRGKEPLRGLHAIIEATRRRREEGITGPDSNTRHVISTIHVSAIGRDHAEAKSVFQFYSNVNATPILVAVGSYEDRFVKRDVWRLANRLIHAPQSS